MISSPNFIKIIDQKTGTNNKQNSNSDLLHKQILPIRCFITETEQGKPIIHKPTVKDELTGKVIEVKEMDPGHFEFTVERGKKYFVECNVVGYKNFEKSVELSSVVTGELNTYEIAIRPYKENEKFILKNIYFHPNTPVFKTQSSNELAELYSFMKNNSTVVISIEGHTNSTLR